MAVVSNVRVDDTGILATTREEVVLDVLFDERRIWSFWVLRDGKRHEGGHLVRWPAPLQRFLEGSTRVAVVEHVSGAQVFDAEVSFGDAPEGTRVAVVNAEGKPLGLDKSNRLAQTFDTRSQEHVAPLLDSIEEVLAALQKAGIDAFPAYGTLLGAVRGGKLIGHDSDADLGYVSEHTHPVDVVRESFRLQRRLSEMGYPITRYSGAAFKVDVTEGDGSVRGLDVFGGFLHDGNLVLMGEICTPFERSWIFPLGTTTLEGRTLPAPADTDRFLTATYGPTWRVPDPAYHFETPNSTHRRLNGWFRGTRVGRENWDRAWSKAHRRGAPAPAPHDLARMVRRREADDVTVIDVGCGRGADLLWLASGGRPGVGLDYAPRGYAAAEELARERDLAVDFHAVNLLELRQVMAWGAQLARVPGPKTVLARHVADATSRVGRQHLWRLAEMALADGGRLYLEFLVPRHRSPRFAEKHFLHPLDPDLVVGELEERGATIVRRVEKRVGAPRQHAGQEGSGAGVPGGRRIARLVVEWQA